MDYVITGSGGNTTVVATINGKAHVASTGHPRLADIISLVESQDDSVVDLFDVEKAVSEFFALTERVGVKDGRLFFDLDPVDNRLADKILGLMREDRHEATLYSDFMENLFSNPNAGSVTQLYEWIDRHNLEILPGGKFKAYKGVTSDFLSTSSGTAVVDGKEVRGLIPNLPGSVVEMPRSEVRYDPHDGCSTGLHVANYEFAENWSEITLEVEVNPRDVVSVPNDSDFQKVRVCRYEILGEV